MLGIEAYRYKRIIENNVTVRAWNSYKTTMIEKSTVTGRQQRETVIGCKQFRSEETGSALWSLQGERRNIFQYPGTSGHVIDYERKTVVFK